MPTKRDPDATASHKSLLLFSLLLFSGRRHSLTELVARLGCSKPTVLRLMRGIELSGVVDQDCSGLQRLRHDVVAPAHAR